MKEFLIKAVVPVILVFIIAIIVAQFLIKNEGKFDFDYSDIDTSPAVSIEGYDKETDEVKNEYIFNGKEIELHLNFDKRIWEHEVYIYANLNGIPQKFTLNDGEEKIKNELKITKDVSTTTFRCKPKLYSSEKKATLKIWMVRKVRPESDISSINAEHNIINRWVYRFPSIRVKFEKSYTVENSDEYVFFNDDERFEDGIINLSEYDGTYGEPLVASTEYVHMMWYVNGIKKEKHVDSFAEDKLSFQFASHYTRKGVFVLYADGEPCTFNGGVKYLEIETRREMVYKLDVELDPQYRDSKYVFGYYFPVNVFAISEGYNYEGDYVKTDMVSVFK